MTPLMTLAQAHALLPGSVQVGDGATPLQRVHSDTRSLLPGDFFVALRGDHFDGHDHLPQARSAGAAAALAERGLRESGLPGLLVPDALAALQQLATAWRARLTLPVIAVTGSNGKTTVTQMIAAILRAWQGDAALATAGNFNNHIGLPLTVLRLRRDGPLPHRVAVLELGMNHPGEIALLAAIAQPTVAVVNNAQREHQEFMASVQAVAFENGAAISALPADGVAVYPADDAQASVWRHLAGARAWRTFAMQGDTDVQGDAHWVTDTGLGVDNAADDNTDNTGNTSHWALHLRTPVGGAHISLHAAGQHNLHNALAAATAALAAGAPLAAVAQGLSAFRPVSGRTQTSVLRLAGQPVLLVNDSYNANPDSVRAAIDLLVSLPGPHWLLLGDMGEVGDRGPAFHAEVGAYARSTGIAHFWAVGSACADAAAAYGPGARHFAEVPALIAALADGPAGANTGALTDSLTNVLTNALTGTPPCAAALVKGSRFMRMETVVAALQTRSAAGQQKAPDAA